MPALKDIWIDKLALEIKATCQPASSSSEAQLRDYFESFPDIMVSLRQDWFRAVRNDLRNHARSIRSKKQTADRSQTLGDIEARLKPRQGGNDGWDLSIKLIVNPTRTLAHLLANYAESEPSGFVELISSLGFAQFFAANENVVRSLDGSTNWIADWDFMLDRLGDDPFATFLPIYLAKIFKFAEAMANPGIEPQFEARGELLQMDDAGMRVEIDTLNVKVSQSEIYLERYHGHAVAGVREAALKAIDQLREIESRFFASDGEGEEVEEERQERATAVRHASSLQISAPLPNKSALAIYPKSSNRVRFEIRRKGTIRWGDSGRAFDAPIERLLSRLTYERGRWIEGGTSELVWSNIFALFREPTRPHISDMAELLAKICEVAVRHDAPVQLLIERLISDGGVVPNDVEGIETNVLDALERAGVMRRVRIARRGTGAATSRYSLHEHYLTVAQELALLPTIRDDLE